MPFVQLYARVLRQLSPVKGLAVVLALSNVALACAQFAEPMLLGRIIDRLGDANGAGWAPLLPWLGAWIAFGLFNIGASVLVALNADKLAHRRRVAAMAAYFERVLHLPMSFHTGAHSGRLLKVMLEGSNAMASVWLSFFREHCASLVSLTVLLPLTLFVNPRLAGILIALVVIFGVAMNLVIRRTGALQNSADALSSDVAERVADVLGNMPVVQSFARIEEETRALGGLIDRMLSAQMPVLTWCAIATVATRASASLSLGAIFVTGIWLDMRGETTIGEIVAFMSLAGMLIGRLEQVVGFVNMMIVQAPKMRQFFEVLDRNSTVVDLPDAVGVGRLHGAVSFDNVSFSHGSGAAAINKVSFSAGVGQTVALVGATGSGKSTTLGLLHRVFDPSEGRVLIDGLDIRQMSLASLRANIGVVFQEPFLFARSIEENLRIGRPDATIAQISAALEQAQASAFVERQSLGLATVLGERGQTLSGGERQRLSIARALLKDPPIMILDEATSALDASTEREIQGALDSAMRERTTFVIAHRLATVRNADHILVFDGGRVVEEGTFDGLVARGGAFAAFVKAQSLGQNGEGADLSGERQVTIHPPLATGEAARVSFEAATG